MEAAMPLIYMPLIMYAGWMEFVIQPLVGTSRQAGVEAIDSIRVMAAAKPLERTRHKA
jgi:hypothetical protein